MTSTLSLELVLTDKRFKIAAAVVGLVVFVMSAGFLISAKSNWHLVKLSSALPEQAYNIPLLRSLPEPEPMMPRNSTAHAIMRAAAAKPGRAMLSRR